MAALEEPQKGGSPGRAWDPWVNAWDENHTRPSAYVEEHRRAPSNRESSLGVWDSSTQRHGKNREGAPPGRQAALEAVPGRSWGPNAAAWDEKYTLLCDFVEERGGIPHQRVSSLGKWVNTQRTGKVRGTLKAWRVASLEAVPGWSWDPTAAAWAKRYASLCA